MSEQSNIRKCGQGRPRKTQEELAINRQRRRVDKNARESFRIKQVRGQKRQQESQETQAIQWPEREEAVSIGAQTYPNDIEDAGPSRDDGEQQNSSSTENQGTA